MLDFMATQKPHQRSVGSSVGRRVRYAAPPRYDTVPLTALLEIAGRPLERDQGGLFRKPDEEDPKIFISGDLDLLRMPSFSVIGARAVSPSGIVRARQIARHLAKHGVVVTSGLAKGVDTAAHAGALEEGGRTIAVIGTPLQKAYPAENASLQQEIYEHHLLVSQFAEGARTFPSDFPKRNRLMAALSDGSIIVEASDTSGTLHQAAECVRLRRWLFIMKSVVDNPDLEWPKKFLKEDRVRVLSSVEDVLAVLP